MQKFEISLHKVIYKKLIVLDTVARCVHARHSWVRVVVLLMFNLATTLIGNLFEEMIYYEYNTIHFKYDIRKCLTT